MIGFLLGAWSLLRGAFSFVAGIVVRYPWQAGLALALVFGVVQMRAAETARAAQIDPATHFTWRSEVSSLILAGREAAAQRNFAIANYNMCRLNSIAQGVAIDTQNAAVQALSVQSARSLQEASQGLARAQRLHATDQQRLAVLGRPLAAATACARADEAAARAREALR